MPPTCIAYLDDGTICGQHATVVDAQRGGMVCSDHSTKPRGYYEECGGCSSDPCLCHCDRADLDPDQDQDESDGDT